MLRVYMYFFPSLSEVRQVDQFHIFYKSCPMAGQDDRIAFGKAALKHFPFPTNWRNLNHGNTRALELEPGS